MRDSKPFKGLSGSEIALIGMSGRFPGAQSIDAFWNYLRDGVESITFLTDEQLQASGVSPEVIDNPNYVKARFLLENVELFDAAFFGVNPREAQGMDPQHRLFLECVYEAIENAGYDADRYGGRISLFAGSGMSSYVVNNIYANPEAMALVGSLQIAIMNSADSLTTYVAYKLNLKGACCSVQTFCSTSLVAVHLACQGLLNFECDMALAGGVTIVVPEKTGYWYEEGSILSPDGHCRAFDAKARGMAFGNGLGVVVLKRLEDALTDGDHIEAVIKGSATNNDGSLKVGYTAPSVAGQAEVIVEALANAGVDPETITYVETHGTGTALGDPTEMTALSKAFRSGTEKRGFCAIGSVKTNIGHLDRASGVASLIKTILMLRHKEIPPSLNFEKPNPDIDFENSPFRVNSKLSPWKVDGVPRRAGVSNFGFGGTNAHVILQEAPIVEPSGPSRPSQFLVLSAKTSSALEVATQNLATCLRQNPHLNLADIAYTLQVGRRPFSHRRMMVCRDTHDALSALEEADPRRVFTVYQEKRNPPVVFMFSGQGAQYVNMGLEVYRTESTFREEVDRCSEVLKPHLSLDLRDILYPESGTIEEQAQKLQQTSITQPALFVVEYALAKLWMSWGINPAAMVGHSIGEYVAACLSGVFSLEDALLLVATRGRLMQQQPAGSMLAVQLSEKDIQRYLNQRLSLAAVNAPSFCVVSGETEVVKQLESDLEKSHVAFTPLHTSHAFHSEMMEPMLGVFKERVGQLTLSAPKIPFLSNLTGGWMTSEEAIDPSYWARHLRHTVRFSDCLQELFKEPNRVLLEVGPGQTLSMLARQHSDGSKGRVVLSSIRHPKEQKSDIAFILDTLGRLWLAGVEVDWSGFYKEERRHRIPLPTYPFERQRYWIDPQSSPKPAIASQKGFQKKSDIAEWFYLPSWKRSLAAKKPSGEALEDQKWCWLLFGDESGWGSELVKRLEQQSQDVIAVQMGRKFGTVSKGIYTVNPQEKEDYVALIRELGIRGKRPQKIVHLWSITENNSLPSGIESFHKFQELGFYSLIFLTQALAKQHMTQSIELDVITNYLHEVTDEGEPLCPEKATVLGACKVIPQEYPNITCRGIDLGAGGSPEKQIEKLLCELSSPPTDSVVAYRGKHRWTQIFEPVQVKLTAHRAGLPADLPVNGSGGIKPRLRERGVYLITGGLGGVGMVLAEFLAKEVKAKIILTGRSEIPVKEQWHQWLATHSETEGISRKIRQVKALEELGAELLVAKADVAKEDQMQGVIAQAEKRFGGIHGVIHAAGIFIEAPIHDVSRDICGQQFKSKVDALYTLEKVLEGRAIDFCLLISSLSSVLGGIGFGIYAAANLFMDAFVQRHNQSNSVPWISINWDAWQFQDDIEQTVKRKNDLPEWSIKPMEGVEAFRRILSVDLGDQVIVSIGDLQARLDKWIKLESLREPEQSKKVELLSLSSRPPLPSEYVAPANPTEQNIAEIWQHVLGIEKVGIHDNFFELGGNSLLAVKMIARLRNRFQEEFPVASIFERPTVHLLSDMILEKEKGQGTPSFVDSSTRGQKRKERRLQRMMQEHGNK
jgi:acyl transferase domain-containing protein/acyl carrier protein